MVDLPEDLDNRDLLAAELVLGLLTGDNLSAALRLRLADRQFAVMVEQWEAHLAPLLDGIPAEQVPDQIWPAIEARLNHVDSLASAVHTLDDSLMLRMKRWRVAAITGCAIAASLALALLVRPSPMVVTNNPLQQQAAAPQLIAQLKGEEEGVTVSTRYDKERGQLNVTIEGIEPGGGVPVLWVVPSDGKPRALGILPTDRAGSLAIEPDYSGFIYAGSVLAMTIEDPKSAPFKAPTTPIIASGKISEI